MGSQKSSKRKTSQEKQGPKLWRLRIIYLALQVIYLAEVGQVLLNR